MRSTIQQQIPFQGTRSFSSASMGAVQPFLGFPRKESMMATLRKRGENWYARIQWRGLDNRMKEKLISLRTSLKVEAHQRLTFVNKYEQDIKEGIEFTFPWLNQSGRMEVQVFTVAVAGEQWMERRRKNKIRKSTLELNQQGLKYFEEQVGSNRALDSIENEDIEGFVDALDAKGLSDTTINIHLRTLKTMLRYFFKLGKLTSVPLIEQRKQPKGEPHYITDNEFQNMMELEWLDDFYKRVFFFYRETGLRLNEPFLAVRSGTWLDIPTASKSNASRSVELSRPLQTMYEELMEWKNNGYGSMLKDSGDHLSKKFKRALRAIGAEERKHFHSLRHTFAVRRILMNVPIHTVKLMMGHASVTTTEVYSNMNLKRVVQDFPTLRSYFRSERDLKDTHLKDIEESDSSYLLIM